MKTVADVQVTDSLSDEHLTLLHNLASLAIKMAVHEQVSVPWKQLQHLAPNVPLALQQPAGAFVTIKIADVLRGCIGYILPTKPVYQAVMENGVNAALRDSRFRPVSLSELPSLEVEVSVLSPPRPIASYTMFHVGQEGIILHKHGCSAVFLPEVAVEQGWNREQTLDNLCRKAGLPKDAWRIDAKLQTFSSQKYSAIIQL